jgi:hypothetical protein
LVQRQRIRRLGNRQRDELAVFDLGRALALDRFGAAQLPAIGGSRASTRTALAGGTLAFMVIKFLAHTSNLGLGCWLGLVAGVALVVLCVREAAA